MEGLLILLIIVAVPAAVGLYWVVKPRLVHRRRLRLRAQPPPQGLDDVLSQNLGLYSLLPDNLREELLGHVSVFLNEKRFISAAGQEITPEVRFTIAGTACLLLLGREPRYFPGFSSIVVYPETYEADHVEYDGVVQTHKRSRRAGESWHRGPVVLSWNNVLHGAKNAGDGYNVVLHEFAHKLDEQNAGTNGLPILNNADHYRDWAKVLGREFRQFADRVSRGKNKVMDEYGLTSPAEFFAVATESYFEKGRAMRKRLPELHEQLRRFYAVDPATWRRQ